MRRFFITLFASLAIFVGLNVAHVQAAPLPEVAHFTLSSVAELQQASEATAKGWDRGTVVDLSLGSCSGPGCIYVSVVPSPCGGAAGCAFPNADGSCNAQVSTQAMQYGRDLKAAVTAHEVGHCMGLSHSDNPNDNMYWAMDPNRPNWITRNDRVRLNAVYGY